ncbi:unnamed protein product [Calypogeia fissa]
MDHQTEVMKELASQQKKAQAAQPKEINAPIKIPDLVGSGPSNPHPVGLPAKPSRAKETRPIEHERVATPTPTSIGSSIAKDVEPKPITDLAKGLTTPTKPMAVETEVIILDGSPKRLGNDADCQTSKP